jgi:hypothetical protein
MLMVGTIALRAQQTPGAGNIQAVVSASDGGGKTPPAKKKKEKPESVLEREVRELREKQAAQQAQIDQLLRALADANAARTAQTQQTQAAAQEAQQAQQTAQAATAQAQTAAASVQQQTEAVQALKTNVTDLQTTNAGLASTISANKVEIAEKVESPSSIRYKGITITPVAFFAFEGVYRERSVNSDVNTPFNSIPFPSANEGHVSELNFTGRQSRLGGLFEGQAGTTKLTGYFESDFLGTGTSSNNNQSNSYVLRQRQIWGQAATKSGFTITGGQMWSLVTEDRHGIDARTEIQPQTIDSQYLVGYSWTRQPEIRLQQRFGDYKTGAFSAAVALEQAQITSFTANGTNPSQYFFGGLGQNGGLYNAAAASATCTTNTTTIATTCTTSNITTYANNVAPDVIVKFAYDVPVFHAEIGGLARFLRDEYFPVLTYGGTASAPTYTYGTTYLQHTASAGGVFGSARGYLFKQPGSMTNPFMELAVQAMAGSGTGRYGSSQLADATLRPDETLEPIKNYHGLASIETRPTPKFDVFMYYGGEYAQRTVYEAPAGNYIGYGPANLSDTGCYNLPAAPTSTIGNGGSTGSLSATSCGSPTKYIQEGMVGFQWRPIVSSKYGKLQYSATYSIIQRQLWAGVGSATTPVSPRAQDSMFHVQMRYYIP